jgi:hypothetical protein
MAIIAQKYVVGLETNMKLLASTEYDRLSQDLVWQSIAKTIDLTDGFSEERVVIPVETAMISHDVAEGYINFRDQVTYSMVFKTKFASEGLRIMRSQMTDSPLGAATAASWAKQMGALFAYEPERLTLNAVKSNPVCQYDSLTYFNTAHPINPSRPGGTKFANQFVGSASGSYPGACPIDVSVSVDVALNSLSKINAYVRTIPMPNGNLPRRLRVKNLFVPPALSARAHQLTDAQFIAQAAGSAAASSDVRAIIANNGLGTPIVVDELAAAFGGSDTTFYVTVEDITPSEMAAFLYVQKEAFEILYLDPMSDSELNKASAFEWTVRGRCDVAPGLPQLMFKVGA